MNDRNIKTISEYHKFRGLPGPKHPLMSLIDYSKIDHRTNVEEIVTTPDFYAIGFKKNIPAKFRYGQSYFDFDEGVMSFFSPNQVIHYEPIKTNFNEQPSGWLLFIHPDFLWNTTLAKSIQHFDFFGYAINEALFLSEDEEKIMAQIFENINKEYNSSIDELSKDIIVAQIELLLNYAKRFYKRQFITREKINHEILTKLEMVLSDYFNQRETLESGLPSVQFIANQLNVSPNYLSSLLKKLTGKSTQVHIHEKLIEKAKEILSTSSLTVNEIAYELGFERPESFSRLFKKKTNQTPLEFRASFN